MRSSKWAITRAFRRSSMADFNVALQSIGDGVVHVEKGGSAGHDLHFFQ